MEQGLVRTGIRVVRLGTEEVIEEVQQRIYDLFAPIEERSVSLEKIIPRKGLKYRLISFESNKKIEQFQLKKIFSKIVKNTKLYEREHIDGLENYLIRQFSG